MVACRKRKKKGWGGAGTHGCGAGCQYDDRPWPCRTRAVAAGPEHIILEGDAPFLFRESIDAGGVGLTALLVNRNVTLEAAGEQAVIDAGAGINDPRRVITLRAGFALAILLDVPLRANT